MGRHGGGSRSGGSSRSSSRSRGGSRSGGGSSTRISKTPFKGCYNRSYYDRRGKYHTYYTSNSSFGTKSGWNPGIIILLIFVTLHMLFMMGGMVMSSFSFGGKVNGDINRIMIVDNADILTSAEEEQTLDLLHEVYNASGMPVTIYTDSFEWKNYYYSLEIYSEELYYQMGYDEDAMIILFTADNSSGFYDWEYDMYCGDDTIRCLSDASFDKLLENFHKGMAGQNFCHALDYSWHSVMDELAKTSFSWGILLLLPFLFFFYGIFYFAIIGSTVQQNAAYKYFKENPNKLSYMPMTLYSECPSCGASNSFQTETCAYCGTLLKISDSNVNFVKPTV